MNRACTVWIIFLAALLASGAEGRFLDTIQEARHSFEQQIEEDQLRPFEKAKVLIRLGRFDAAGAILDSLPLQTANDTAGVALLRYDILLANYDFDEAGRILDGIADRAAISEGLFRRRYRLLSVREDLAAMDRITGERVREQPGSVAGRLGRGSLLYQLMRYDEAVVEYEEALALAREPDDGVTALYGLLLIAYKQKEYEEAAELGMRALEGGPPSTALINGLVTVQIRLGETRDAIALCREVLRWDPNNERAHYTLGNGYSDMNYTELATAYPDAFPKGKPAPALGYSVNLLEVGKRAQAMAHLINLKKQNPDLADPDLYLGNIFWEDGEPDSAIAHFRASLEICPDYGRAHNAFAKAMEWKKLRVNAHRETYEQNFADKATPDIPRIEEFVLNYTSLTARHRKQVALSIEPWARFVPVLIEAGATYYIKPLYERLSETPHQELMADLRISYDSRLWDDVRGCGGFHTVTGIEDVERTVFNKYNTVLHELSHQVHYIMTPGEKRNIQEEYRRAKEEEESGKKTFVTRYQGSSVWEYFAEGTNSLFSPKRDEYDSREIVRERLEKLDPPLIKLVADMIADTSTARYYAPAYVIAAYDKIENAELAEAVGFLEKALERSPRDESALCGLAYTRSILAEHDLAVESGKRATDAHSAAPEPWISRADAVYHKTGSPSDRISLLLEARERVDRNQRYLIELALGNAYMNRGDLRQARESYGRVLDYQDDNPEALWGLAYSYGFNGEREKADDLFRKALRRRSGIVELRTDYARYLIRQERFDEAEEQLREARVLDPANTDVEATAGLLAIYRVDLPEAKARLKSALEYADYNDLATVMLAHAYVASGETGLAEKTLRPLLESVERGDPPGFIYVKKKATYLSIHEHPAEERWMLYNTTAKLARAVGDTARAREYDLMTEQTFR